VTTTPENVKKRLPPVAALALPSGATRAISASQTPFQPTAVAPNSDA
jgi:hypothetical protein